MSKDNDNKCGPMTSRSTKTGQFVHPASGKLLVKGYTGGPASSNPKPPSGGTSVMKPTTPPSAKK